MPKLKSHRGARKRIRLTARGKAKRNRESHSHLLEHKSRKRKRRLRKATLVDKTRLRSIRELLLYKAR